VAALPELGLAAAQRVGGALAHDLQRPFRRIFAAVAIDGSVLRGDLAPVALQLFGDHHGIGGPHPLAEFGLGNAYRHGIVGRDDDPGIDLLHGRFSGPCGAFRIDVLAGGTLRHPEADHQRAGRSGGGEQKIAARRARMTEVLAHQRALPAAGIREAAR
jgi:hypothetical protein